MSRISPGLSTTGIAGPLSFGSPPTTSLFTGGIDGLASNYVNAYQNALNLNQGNYNNILRGYQGLANSQALNQQGIGQGYQDLYNNVLGSIQGIGASQQQSLDDLYARQRGASNQQLLNSGLGNTTVRGAMDRGLTLDQGKANTNLANQIAQTQAGYMSNLGLAGLGYSNEANMQNTALGGRQLDWMNSIYAPYPDAGLYGQLAAQYGQGQQAAANRAMLMGLLGGQGGYPQGYPQGGPMSFAPGQGAGSGNPAYLPSGDPGRLQTFGGGPFTVGVGNPNVPQGGSSVAGRYPGAPGAPGNPLNYPGRVQPYYPGGGASSIYGGAPGGFTQNWGGGSYDPTQTNIWNSATFSGSLPGGGGGGGPLGPIDFGGSSMSGGYTPGDPSMPYDPYQGGYNAVQPGQPLFPGDTSGMGSGAGSPQYFPLGGGFLGGSSMQGGMNMGGPGPGASQGSAYFAGPGNQYSSNYQSNPSVFNSFLGQFIDPTTGQPMDSPGGGNGTDTTTGGADWGGGEFGAPQQNSWDPWIQKLLATYGGALPTMTMGG